MGSPSRVTELPVSAAGTDQHGRPGSVGLQIRGLHLEIGGQSDISLFGQGDCKGFHKEKRLPFLYRDLRPVMAHKVE